MSPIDPSALAALRGAISSSAAVHLPGEDGYSIKRWAVNAEKPAALVACPATPEDIVQILAFAQGKSPYESQKPLEIVVKSGGVSPSGASSSDGGIVIDLHPNMQNVRIDPKDKLAYVGAGCLSSQVEEAAIKDGLAPVSGVLNQIGGGPLTLEAGYGWLTGQYGLVIDNTVQITVVTPSGDVLTASESENSDLFWALRGGGGNFGVVTEFVYRLHEQCSDVYSSVLVFPPPKVGDVIPELNSWLSERTPAENVAMIYTVGSTGQPVLVLHFAYNGDPEEGAAKFERFKKLCPVRDISGTLPFTKLSSLQNDYTKPGKLATIRGDAIPAISTGIPVDFVTDTFTTWLKFLKEHPAAENVVVFAQLFHPDKRCSVPSDATAYPNRDKTYVISYMMQWTDPGFTSLAQCAIDQLTDVFNKSRDKHFPSDSLTAASLSHHLNEAVSVNSEVQKRFGNNYQRLVEVKNKYDPKGLLGQWFLARSVA
ncbi:hypothetical protein FRC12_018959 [Ceratobasidium sp. 428]|nr:hypothetical protein FRC12_018959 [Ceratobasidium sp. 428]